MAALPVLVAKSGAMFPENVQQQKNVAPVLTICHLHQDGVRMVLSFQDKKMNVDVRHLQNVKKSHDGLTIGDQPAVGLEISHQYG